MRREWWLSGQVWAAIIAMAALGLGYKVAADRLAPPPADPTYLRAHAYTQTLLMRSRAEVHHDHLRLRRLLRRLESRCPEN